MEQLENKPSWKDSMRKCCRSNKLNIELASAYTPLRFRASYARFKAMQFLLDSAINVEARIKDNGGLKISLKPSNGWSLL